MIPQVGEDVVHDGREEGHDLVFLFAAIDHVE